MADASRANPSIAGRLGPVFDRLRSGDAIVLVWVGLVFAALGAPSLVTETVILNDGWPAYSAALETSLRWHFGHLPHLDYHTPVGIAYWLNQGLAVEAVGFDPRSSLVANLMSGAVIVLVGLFLVRARLARLMTAVLMTGVMSLVLSLRPFDAAGAVIGDIAAPGRTGLAIVAVLLVTFFLEPRTERRPWAAALESVLVASLLVWLAFLDAYLAALMLLGGAAAMAFPSASRGLILEAMTFTALACVGLGFLYGIGIPYLADIEAVIAAAPVLRLGKLIGDLQANLIPLGIVIVALGGYLLVNRAGEKVRTDIVAVTVILIFANFLAINRTDTVAMPLAFIVLVMVVARAQHPKVAQARRRDVVVRILSKKFPAHIPAVVGAFFLVANAGGADVMSLKTYLDAANDAAAARLCQAAEQPVCSIRIMSAGDLVAPVLPDPAIVASFAPDALDAFLDGAPSVDDRVAACQGNAFCLRRALYSELIGLLNLVMTDVDTPFLLGAANPLPYYYGVEPPRRVMSVLAPGLTISLKRHPDARSLFSDVSILVVPRSDRQPDFEPALLRFYAGDIARMFETIAETDAWSIYRKVNAK